MRLRMMIPVICLAWPAAGQADPDYIEVGAGIAGDNWRAPTSDMAASEYAATARHNRRMLFGLLTGGSHMTDDLHSLQFQLHTRSPLKLRVHDTFRSKRTLLLEFSKDW